MAVTTREQLKQYALRALGAPVVQINVADEQLEDRLDEAIAYFQLYHYDGIERMYLKHQITQTDVNNQYVTLPDYVYGVKKVIPFRQGSSSQNLFDVQYQLRLNDLYELTNTSMVYYSMVMQHMAMLDQLLNGYPQFEFNRLGGKLYLEVNKTKMIVGDYMIVECYRALDPATNSKMWGEPWLKQYVEALFKKAWATNLKKYQGMQLPGGVTVDGQSMYLEATQEIKDLEEDLMTKSAPLGFMVG
jgi:hypothetical protein